MDHLARLIRVVALLLSAWLLCALAFLPLPAHAVGSIGPTTGYTYRLSCNGQTLNDSSAQGVLNQCVALYNGSYETHASGCGWIITRVRSYALVSTDFAAGEFKWSGTETLSYKPTPVSGCTGSAPDQVTDFGSNNRGTIIGPTVMCDVTSQMTGTGASTICLCKNGTNPAPDKKSCVPITCPASGSYTAQTAPDQQVPNAGDSICSGGCGFQPSGWAVAPDGKIWARWPFYSTGQYCGGAPSTDDPRVDTGEKNNSNPAPVACGAGMCPGSFNGANVCVACSSQTTQGPSSSTSAPAGSASGASGTTTTSQTSCNGATCTTTTTTTDSSTGAVVGQKTDTQDQKSWCQLNPTSPMCKDSLWGGSCASGFQCDGDAIQCAIARRTYQTACSWETRVPVISDAGDAAISGGSRPATHPGNDASVVPIDFASQIDQSDALGVSSCPTDQSFAFNGHQLVLPWSLLCGPLQLVGNVFVAVSLLAAAFIVFKN